MQQQQTATDTSVSWKLAGTIAAALLVVFVLQKLDFRFVVAAGR